jgi:hypothetical protein
VQHVVQANLAIGLLKKPHDFTKPPASEVAGEHSVPFQNWHTMPFLKW